MEKKINKAEKYFNKQKLRTVAIAKELAENPKIIELNEILKHC